jgi:hypothetical protein
MGVERERKTLTRKTTKREKSVPGTFLSTDVTNVLPILDYGTIN